MNKRQQILKWHQQGFIDESQLEKSLKSTNAQLSYNNWYGFLSKALVYLGITSFALGVIFFFAFNWEKMSVFYKFALIQGLLLVVGFTYFKSKSHTLLSNGLLLFLVLLIGALMALFGQTYQTGKDPWQLFFFWVLFTIPIAYVSKSNVLWTICLVLANLCLSLFFDVNDYLFGIKVSYALSLILLLLLNVVLAVIFKQLLPYEGRDNKPFVFYTALLGSIFFATGVGLFTKLNIVNHVILVFAYVFFLVGIYYIYRIKQLDVLILSAWSLSIIVVLLSTISNLIGHTMSALSFLTMSLSIITLSTIATKWLMGLVKEKQEEVR